MLLCRGFFFRVKRERDSRQDVYDDCKMATIDPRRDARTLKFTSQTRFVTLTNETFKKNNHYYAGHGAVCIIEIVTLHHWHHFVPVTVSFLPLAEKKMTWVGIDFKCCSCSLRDRIRRKSEISDQSIELKFCLIFAFILKAFRLLMTLTKVFGCLIFGWHTDIFTWFISGQLPWWKWVPGRISSRFLS